jgi:hypothetical protein
MAWASNPVIRRKAGGDNVEMLHYPEAAGQSYKKGQLVEAVAGALTATATDEKLVLGIAQQDATGTAGSVSGLTQMVEPIYPGDEVEFTTTATVTEAMRGLAYALTVTSNICYIDCTDTSNDFAVFKAPVYTAAGALQAKAIFTILPVACQLTSASGT